MVKVELKVQTLGSFLFYENSNPSGVFFNNVCFARVLPRESVSNVRP